MGFYSPLRYPGGKNKLAKFIELVCKKNDVHGHYVEPYAGGASVALHLLLNDCMSEITINDIDRSIYAFWYSVLNDTENFCRLINETDVNIENWKTYRDVQKNKDSSSLLDLGFSTFFLNRTNMSGVINGGVIGGLKQNGKYKIDCRFNKIELISRIRRIAEYKTKIHLYNLDAMDLIKIIQKMPHKKRTIFYFDPPYYLKGESLYLNHYDPEDHEKVGTRIKNIKNSKWIVSYDDAEEIKTIYKGYKKIEYSFFHSAHRAKQGREVLFFSRAIFVPEVGNPTKPQDF